MKPAAATRWLERVRRASTGMLASTAVSIATKGLQALAGFTTVHQLVRHWGLPGYGLWVTLTAFALYVSLFDLGVGFGIKNRVSEAWGAGRVEDAAAVVRAGVAVYVLAALAAAAGGVGVVLLVTPFREHVAAAGLLWSACVIAFMLSLHNTLLAGLGRFNALSLLGLIAPCAWCAALLAWPRGVALTLEQGAMLYAGAMLAQAVATVGVSRAVHRFDLRGWYRTTLAEFMPLLRTGARFLVLQLANFAFNGSGSLLVYRALGGAETAQYDAANRVFSIFTIAYSTLAAIAWTEISRAKVAANPARIVAVRRTLQAAVAAFAAAAVAASAFSVPLTHALTGIAVGPVASAAFAFFVVVQMLVFTFAVFLNAYERLREQIVGAALSIPLFFGVAFALFAQGWGMPAVPAAAGVALLPSLAICFVVARRLPFALAPELAR